METSLRLNRITKTDTINKDGEKVKTIRYSLNANFRDAKITLSVSFEEQVPSDWERIIGSTVGNYARIEIGPDSQQTTLETAKGESPMEA